MHHWEETRNLFQMQIRAKCVIRLRSLRGMCEGGWDGGMCCCNWTPVLGTAVHCQNITAFFPKQYPPFFVSSPGLSLSPWARGVPAVALDWGEEWRVLLHHGSSEGAVCAVHLLSVKPNSSIKKKAVMNFTLTKTWCSVIIPGVNWLSRLLLTATIQIHKLAWIKASLPHAGSDFHPHLSPPVSLLIYVSMSLSLLPSF